MHALSGGCLPPVSTGSGPCFVLITLHVTIISCVFWLFDACSLGCAVANKLPLCLGILYSHSPWHRHPDITRTHACLHHSRHTMPQGALSQVSVVDLHTSEVLVSSCWSQEHVLRYSPSQGRFPGSVCGQRVKCLEFSKVEFFTANCYFQSAFCTICLCLLWARVHPQHRILSQISHM